MDCFRNQYGRACLAGLQVPHRLDIRHYSRMLVDMGSNRTRDTITGVYELDVYCDGNS